MTPQPRSAHPISGRHHHDRIPAPRHDPTPAMPCEAAGQEQAYADRTAALHSITEALARGAGPHTLPQSVLADMARAFGADYIAVVRYDNAQDARVIVDFATEPITTLRGRTVAIDADCAIARVYRTSAPQRIADYALSRRPGAQLLGPRGIRSAVVAPVRFADNPWGAVILGAVGAHPLPRDAEQGLLIFANLLATALLHRRTTAALLASRARVIDAADTARRGFERDLHDGAQQRLVSLSLQLQMLQAALPPEAAAVHDQLAEAVRGVTELHTDLQRLARGLHPSILSTGGLIPALKALARRSAIAVTLTATLDDHDLGEHESLCVAAYYVVAESLTNATKHAHATHIDITVTADQGTLRITVADDGIGGAELGRGSGLIGLADRVQSLTGDLEVISHPGTGTTVKAFIPLPSQ